MKFFKKLAALILLGAMITPTAIACDNGNSGEKPVKKIGTSRPYFS